MDNSIYEVSRDEYVGFLRQIKRDALDVKIEQDQNDKVIKTFSKKTGNHFCTRIVPKEGTENEGNEQYYVFNMPQSSQRQDPKPVQKIVLETQEEVQAFFNILSKINSGKEKQ